MTSGKQAISEAVSAYLERHDEKPLMQLGENDRREALRQLGYSTPAHLAMFGL